MIKTAPSIECNHQNHTNSWLGLFFVLLLSAFLYNCLQTSEHQSSDTSLYSKLTLNDQSLLDDVCLEDQNDDGSDNLDLGVLHQLEFLNRLKVNPFFPSKNNTVDLGGINLFSIQARAPPIAS